MKQTISERLTAIINFRNLRQIDLLELCRPLCEKSGIKISKSELSSYISGKHLPKTEKLTILALALKVNEVWLMGYNVPPDPDYFDNKKNNNKAELKVDPELVEMLNLLNNLDIIDRAEIRGEIRQMLKSNKYNRKRGLSKAL